MHTRNISRSVAETELQRSASALSGALPPGRTDRVPAWAVRHSKLGVRGGPIAVAGADDERFQSAAFPARLHEIQNLEISSTTRPTPAGYTVRAVGRLHLALCGRANRCPLPFARCEARPPPRTPAHVLTAPCRRIPGVCFVLCPRTEQSPRCRSLRGGNGNRQRPTAQTHGLQQLARDKALSRITVLLRPILHAWPHVCRVV